MRFLIFRVRHGQPGIEHLECLGLRGGDVLHPPIDAPAPLGGWEPPEVAPGDAGCSPSGAGVHSVGERVFSSEE